MTIATFTPATLFPKNLHAMPWAERVAIIKAVCEVTTTRESGYLRVICRDCRNVPEVVRCLKAVDHVQVEGDTVILWPSTRTNRDYKRANQILADFA